MNLFKSAKKVTKILAAPTLSRLRPGNIVMYHIGRCGSRVLGSLLGQHPRIFWDGEIFSPVIEAQRLISSVRPLGESSYELRKFLHERMQQALHRYYGLEVKPFHNRQIARPLDVFLSDLDSLDFTHFIILDRKNRLRKILSSLIARKSPRGYHQKSKTAPLLTRVTVDVDKIEIDFDAKPLIDFLYDYDDQFNTLNNLLRDKNVLDLTYEEDIESDPRYAYREVCKFLGLEIREVKIQYSKTNPFPIKDIVENFSELESVLIGTPFDWMLKE